MIDLKKETEKFLLDKGYKGFASHTLFPKFMAEFATQSKYVQAEKLKAQIEVLEFAKECIEIALFKDGLEEYSDSYYELIEIENKLAEKRQQLNALTNEN
jgi:hypothetical protein